MDHIYNATLESMESTFDILAARVEQPKAVPFGKGFVYRYAEKNIHQALVQKLARVISGLRAARLLLDHGFVQEQAALQRLLDETNEDVAFLAHGIIVGNVTDLHREYLDAFYEEEYDVPDSALESSQKRPMVPRQKIRAYLAREETPSDPSASVEIHRTISKVYSGYVHGASPHIMDMYGGNPPRFHVGGLLGTDRVDDHKEDIWNMFYRSIGSFVVTAKAFGDEALTTQVLVYMRSFAKAAGQSYAHPQDAPEA